MTRLCAESGQAIVVEDDLLTSPHFLRYMNDALQRYRDEASVMQVAGYMFPVELELSEDALFLPFVGSWGWATWARAWAHFDPAAGAYEALKADRKLRRRFDLNGAYPYFQMLEMQLRGQVDSWAIRWYLSTFMRDGLTLYPRKSLVENIGFDGSGVHGDMRPSSGAGRCGGAVSTFPQLGVRPALRDKVYDHLAGMRNLRARLAYLIRRGF